MTFKLLIRYVLFAILALGAGVSYGDSSVLKIGVVENSPPMSGRGADGKAEGFGVAIADALCAEMKVKCQFVFTTLDYLIDDLAEGYFDFVALGLLVTPERQKKILFSQSVYRSISIWLAKPGVVPGGPNVRISTFRGSAQEKYIKAHGWDSVSSQSYTDFIDQLSVGVTNAAIAPLMTSLNLQKDPRFLQLGLVPTVLRAPEMEGDACFGISPKRPELKVRIDRALTAVREKGIYSQINTRYIAMRID